MSGMTGTGEKKCMPTNLLRRASGSAAARRVIEIELVLLASTAVAGAVVATSAKSSRLTCSSSKTASMTSSALRAASASEVATAMRLS